MASGTVRSRDAVLEPPGTDVRRVPEGMFLPLPVAPKFLRNTITIIHQAKPSFIIRF